MHDENCHPFVLPSERLSLWFCIVCEVSVSVSCLSERASFSFMYLVRNSGSNWQNNVGMSTKVKCCGECIHCCDLVSGRHSFAVWYEEANYMCYCSESRVKIIITE